MQTLPPTAHPQQEGTRKLSHVVPSWLRAGARQHFLPPSAPSQSLRRLSLPASSSPVRPSSYMPQVILHAPGELTPVIAAPSSCVNVIVTPANWEANRSLTFTLHVKFPFPVKEILAKIKNNVAFSIQTLPFRLTWMYLLFALSKSPGSFYINH